MGDETAALDIEVQVARSVDGWERGQRVDVLTRGLLVPARIDSFMRSGESDPQAVVAFLPTGWLAAVQLAELRRVAP